MEITRLSCEELELIRKKREEKKKLEENYLESIKETKLDLEKTKNNFIKQIENYNKQILEDLNEFNKIYPDTLHLNDGELITENFERSLYHLFLGVNENGYKNSEVIRIEPLIYHKKHLYFSDKVYFIKSDGGGYRCSVFIPNLQCRSYKLKTIFEKYFEYVDKIQEKKIEEEKKKTQLQQAEQKLKEIYPSSYKIEIKDEYKSYSTRGGKSQGYYIKRAFVTTPIGFTLNFEILNNKIIFDSISGLNKVKLSDINEIVKILEKDESLGNYESTSIPLI